MKDTAKELIKQSALKLIALKINAIQELLDECETIAKDANVEFGFHPVYGMGGYFDPNEGWLPSSQSC